jgi:hypothetical protein
MISFSFCNYFDYVLQFNGFSHNGLQLKEVGGIYGNAFAEKILSFTTNLSRGTLPPISFRCCYGMGY